MASQRYMLLVEFNDYISKDNYIQNYFTTEVSTINTSLGLAYRLDDQAASPNSFIYQQFKDVVERVMLDLQIGDSADVIIYAAPNRLHYGITTNREFLNYTYFINNQDVKTIGDEESLITVVPENESRLSTNTLIFHKERNDATHLGSQATTGDSDGTNYVYSFYNAVNSGILSNSQARNRVNIDNGTFRITKNSDTDAAGLVTQLNGDSIASSFVFTEPIRYKGHHNATASFDPVTQRYSVTVQIPYP